jgi:DNA mismatch repair protein MutS
MAEMYSALNRQESGQTPDKLSPMLTQYLDYKKRYSECLIFFQVGDFYEIFFEDALVAAEKLNITLTSRDKNSANPIPMCGVPLQVVDTYVDRLVDQGYSVALVSQAVPSSSVKGMVPRELERIITPGVRVTGGVDSRGQEERGVCALYLDKEGEGSLVHVHVESARIKVRENLLTAQLVSEIAKIDPAEVIIPRFLEGRRLDGRSELVKKLSLVVPESVIKFRMSDYEREIRPDLKNNGVFSALSSGSKKALRLLLDYLDEVTVRSQIPVNAIEVEDDISHLGLDPTTRKNLELVRNLKDGSERGTLYQFMNRTVTPQGARTIRQFILNPLKSPESIELRLETVATLKDCDEIRDGIRALMRYTSDLERLAARIELGLAVPSELAALCSSLRKITLIKDALSAEPLKGAKELQRIQSELSVPVDLYNVLETALLDEPARSLNTGGIFKKGYSAELDRLRGLRENSLEWMREYEESQRIRTGIASLRVKFNNIIGYFIEITRNHASRAPSDYIKRQSTVNAERYLTEQLSSASDELLNSEAKSIALERSLFEALRDDCKNFTREIRAQGYLISLLDVYGSLAEMASKEDLTRPVVSSGKQLVLKGAKHPVLMNKPGLFFVPNDLLMEDGLKSYFQVLTGPNMGGKSTYLRQCALIVIMAQIGSFVPAQQAQIGVVDKVFARLGASDDMLEGESTFMVEMLEASYILANATSQSLILIDEIGRGTATLDGLAIAQAMLEWMIDKIAARTLFATHFHELTVLEKKHAAIKNVSVGVIESGEEVVFTHEIKEGAASRSYGLEVAKKAFLPDSLLERAWQIVSRLESREKKPLPGEVDATDLFFEENSVSARPPRDYKKLKELEKTLKLAEVNSMTPLMALNFLSAIKEKL